MPTHRLYKKQKLCSPTAIDALFKREGADVASCLAFPLRAVWRSNPGRGSDAPLQFLISVPKRRLHEAVDRVKMRRRIREAYRLQQFDCPLPDGSRIDVAFVYVSQRIEPYDKVSAAVEKILSAISESQKPQQ